MERGSSGGAITMRARLRARSRSFFPCSRSTSRPRKRPTLQATANGRPTAAISATRVMRRSSKSTRATSARSRSRGASASRTWARRRSIAFQSTPLVVDGVLYTTGGTRRAVTALDAATGEQLWVYSLNEGARGAEAPRQLSGRGLAFWQRGDDKRVHLCDAGLSARRVECGDGPPHRELR